MTGIAVLGLGEAGATLAAGLVAAGYAVAAFDPAAPDTPAGVERRDDPASAVAGADLVLAVTPASAAATALESALAALRDGAIYADLSTSSPAVKRGLAVTAAAAAGVGFVDVALMAPVPAHGLCTPALAAGGAAQAFAATMRPLGMPVEVVGPEPGQAATRKLLRSVVMKGLAQLLIEALTAAEAAGVRDETWANLVAQLTSVDEELVDRLVTATERHAPRRLEEMEATIELLGDLGVDATMSTATAKRLSRQAGRGAPTPGAPR